MWGNIDGDLIEISDRCVMRSTKCCSINSSPLNYLECQSLPYKCCPIKPGKVKTNYSDENENEKTLEANINVWESNMVGTFSLQR